MRLLVLGAGAWGTALAIQFAKRHDVTLVARDAEQAIELVRAGENVRYLPGFKLPTSVSVSASLQSLNPFELAIIATPVSGLRDALQSLRQSAPQLPLLWACKGLETASGLLPHQIVEEEHPTVVCGALSGPSFAQELAKGLPTAVVLASRDMGFARDTAQALHGDGLRVYANVDVVGVEVGGAVKNVLAIATGISDGLGLGMNARAALVTRGLAEITRFGVALGARSETFMGLAGVGDLLLTCTGDLSRNRRVGFSIAEGKALDVITREIGHVAEGVSTAYEVARCAEQLGIDMPITKAVVEVLAGRLSANVAARELMARDPKNEVY